ncbi:MAG TPA: hypothetical protein VGB26_10010 [Nitrospiria bacterium]
MEPRVTAPLKKLFPTLDETQIWSAYRDFLNIYCLIKECEKNLGKGDVFDLKNNNAPHSEIELHLIYKSFIESLLKALFMFGDILIKVTVTQLFGKWDRENFLKLHFPPFLIPQHVLLPVHCITVYRNKLIVHHDVRRMQGFFTSNGKFHISPLPQGISAPEEETAKVEYLCRKYGKFIGGLESEPNYFNRLNLLFKHIPLVVNGEGNPDRTDIDRIAEKGGCKSLTDEEVLAGCDCFLFALAEVPVRN